MSSKTTAPFDWQARAARLPGMFVAGSEFPGKSDRIAAKPVRIGELLLPTGRIATGDPTDGLPFEPFSREVPAGTFPVEISLAALAPDVSRIAAVRVVFSDDPVVAWEPATGGAGADTPGAGGLRGYEGAHSVLIDAQTWPLLEAFLEEVGVEWWYEVPKTQGRLYEYGSFRPDGSRPENCVWVSPGNTDAEAVFLSYWGLDAGGRPVMLVTDFDVIP
jgi:hypothetical protein